MSTPSTVDQSRASNAWASGCAWIDGRYVPIEEARIPLLDTGFIHSDLTYDVVGVWEGRLFRLDDHLERLFRGCGRLRIDPPVTAEGMREIIVGVLQRSGLRDANVLVVVTRGMRLAGDRDPRDLTARMYCVAMPFVWIVGADEQESGTTVVVTRDTLRVPPASVDPTVKNFQHGDLIRAQFEAYDRDARLPILPDADGLVTEGAGFNVFVLRGGTLQTPARGVLEGITRRTVIEIAEELGTHPVSVGDVPVNSLYDADEVFLTSTAGGVMPVASVDGRRIGPSCPGPCTEAIRARYWELHRDPRYSVAVDYEPAR